MIWWTFSLTISIVCILTSSSKKTSESWKLFSSWKSQVCKRSLVSSSRLKWTYLLITDTGTKRPPRNHKLKKYQLNEETIIDFQSDRLETFNAQAFEVSISKLRISWKRLYIHFESIFLTTPTSLHITLPYRRAQSKKLRPCDPLFPICARLPP